MREFFGGLMSVLMLLGAVYAGWVGFQAGGWLPAIASGAFIFIIGAIILSLFDVIWRIFSRLSRL